MKFQRLCTECEEFFELDLTPDQLQRRDRAAEYGGIAYVCDTCSGQDQLSDGVEIDDDCWEWDGDDDDYVCHNCGDALSHELVGTGAMCHNCEYYAEHPHDEIEYDEDIWDEECDNIEDEIDRKADLMAHGRL